MFIVIDGADGTFKTTRAKDLVNKFLGNGIYTSEPTEPIPESGDLLEFFIEDRRRHQEDIKKWLSEGKDVVCDRYKYSTIVYQHLLGHPIEKLIELNKEFIIPDFTFIHDSTIDRVMTAIESREETKSIFETREIQEKVLKLFRLIPKFFPNERIVLIESTPFV